MFQSVPIGKLCLAERMPFPTTAVRNREAIIFGGLFVQCDDGLGKMTQPDIALFTTAAWIRGKSDHLNWQNCSGITPILHVWNRGWFAVASDLKINVGICLTEKPAPRIFQLNR